MHILVKINKKKKLKQNLFVLYSKIDFKWIMRPQDSAMNALEW